MRKCLFGHKWEYGNHNYVVRLVKISGEIVDIDNKTCKHRICEKCNKKQVNYESELWRDVQLNEKDKRNQKLEQLGI